MGTSYHAVRPCRAGVSSQSHRDLATCKCGRCTAATSGRESFRSDAKFALAPSSLSLIEHERGAAVRGKMAAGREGDTWKSRGNSDPLLPPLRTVLRPRLRSIEHFGVRMRLETRRTEKIYNAHIANDISHVSFVSLVEILYMSEFLRGVAKTLRRCHLARESGLTCARSDVLAAGTWQIAADNRDFTKLERYPRQ